MEWRVEAGVEVEWEARPNRDVEWWSDGVVESMAARAAGFLLEF